MNSQPTPRKNSVAPNAAKWRPVTGGVTAPQGYLAAGVAAGIKKEGPDLSIVYAPSGASAAAVFTTNLIQAAPVVLSRENLVQTRGSARAVLINSGCANACTGERGMQDARRSARALGSALGISEKEVIVASTGVIGEPLPVRKVLAGITRAVSVLDSGGGDAAARAIMTTDTCSKTAAYESNAARLPLRIGGMAKGSGMIHPNMATMLSVITTDAVVTPTVLSKVFRRVVDRTFNCLTVDGDTSTNDMVVVLANGASGVRIDSSNLSCFEQGLELVCGDLARIIARDGEGASKFVEIHVRGAATARDARLAAKAIAHSPLVKTALCGEEANWGRIMCAAGYSGARFDPERSRLSLCGVQVFRNGRPVSGTKARAEKALKARDLIIDLDLGAGPGVATVWTCDLTREYIDINASYIS
jgi:glutamate N-acetyltransferase / amino-acid N-acetyltransferase